MAKVLNVKKNPIKTAQNMLNFGRKIKVYLLDSDYKFISQDCQRYLERTAKKRFYVSLIAYLILQLLSIPEQWGHTLLDKFRYLQSCMCQKISYVHWFEEMMFC
jgi:hypothetical protein